MRNEYKSAFRSANYDQVTICIKKGLRDEWKREAIKRNQSLAQFIQQCVAQAIDQNCTGRE